MFPDARIVFTRRAALDVCLSNYFLHLDHGQAYALDLLDTGHFLQQHDRLMDHWQRLYPGDIGSATGWMVDGNARLLDASGEPLPGLYAVGNDQDSIMGGVYPAPGITLGPALVFAGLAARHLMGSSAP